MYSFPVTYTNRLIKLTICQFQLHPNKFKKTNIKVKENVTN